MKNLLFTTNVLTLFFVLSGCGSNSTAETKKDVPKENRAEDVQTDAEVVTKPEPNRSVDTLTTTQLKQLKPFFKPTTIEEIDRYIKTLCYVKTDAEFEKAYHSAKPLFDKMNAEMGKKKKDAYELVDDMKFMKKIFALRPSCVAECTEFAMNYDFNDMLKLAKETTGTADDEFFRMKIYCEGEEGTYNPGWFTYFTRTWDYGGGVELGNNVIYKFLKESWVYEKKTKLFKEDVDQLRSETIGIMGHPVYMQSQEKVLAELDKIMKENIVSASEKKKLMEYRKRNEDVEKADEPLLQFDCATKDCDFGG